MLKERQRNTASRFLLAAVFILAGMNHFRNPAFYDQIMPPFLPFPRALIYVSGAAEIVLGALVLTRWKRLAGVGLILLLLAVFPANVYAALALNSSFLAGLLLWLRLPLQGLLIWWVWRVCELSK